MCKLLLSVISYDLTVCFASLNYPVINEYYCYYFIMCHSKPSPIKCKLKEETTLFSSSFITQCLMGNLRIHISPRIIYNVSVCGIAIVGLVLQPMCMSILEAESHGVIVFCSIE